VPVPKRKTGKAKKNMRRSHHAIDANNLIECPNCGEKTMPHRVCRKCGYYKARTVLKGED
jgi:large subunit ribosomal protein L32